LLLQKKEDLMSIQDDDMLPEYDLDSLESRPNRFAEKYNNRIQRAVVLDADVAEGFPDAESVNEALRSLLRSAEKEETELQTK
jgi:hypothetical protein